MHEADATPSAEQQRAAEVSSGELRKHYWRSLAEQRDAESVRQLLADELPFRLDYANRNSVARPGDAAPNAAQSERVQSVVEPVVQPGQEVALQSAADAEQGRAVRGDGSPKVADNEPPSQTFVPLESGKRKTLTGDAGTSRREFMRKSLGGLIAAAGLEGCDQFRQPDEPILPYISVPEELIPGRPLYYASALETGGVGVGIIAESHEGRPTKIEGNPDHSGSRGAANLFTQAAILDLYDPDRTRNATDNRRSGRFVPLEFARKAVRGYAEQARRTKGTGFHLLLENSSSPTICGNCSYCAKTFPR